MAFMAFAFGGANQFFGKQIAHAHRKMILERGLNLTHFDAVAGMVAYRMLRSACRRKLIPC